MAAKKNNKRDAAAHGLHRLSTLRFYDGAYILNTASGMFYRLTPAADYLLRAYDAGAEIHQFADLIQGEYGVDHASSVRDVELMLNQFVALGFLNQRQLQAQK